MTLSHATTTSRTNFWCTASAKVPARTQVTLTDRCMNTSFCVDNLRAVLKSQYHASLAMLHEAITRCPDEVWSSRAQKNAFWQIAYVVPRLCDQVKVKELTVDEPILARELERGLEHRAKPVSNE
jgi:lambda repressor-like predicted transcriptional regulator